MSFPSAIATAYAKILTFRGRASRSEFWSFFVFQLMLAGGIAYWLFYEVGMAQLMPMIEGNKGMLIGACILTQLPGLSLIVRRLHDSGRSGWWMLIALVPVFGVLALFVLLIQPSAWEANRYDTPQAAAPGRNTKAAAQMTPIPVECRSACSDVRALYQSRIGSIQKSPVLRA